MLGLSSPGTLPFLKLTRQWEHYAVSYLTGDYDCIVGGEGVAKTTMIPSHWTHFRPQSDVTLSWLPGRVPLASPDNAGSFTIFILEGRWPRFW